MVNGIKKKARLSQSLPQRKNTDSFGMQRWFSLLQYTEVHISTTENLKKKNTTTKNYDIVETRKKLALYENIKFYDYIP